MTIQSSTLAWKIPWTEDPGGLQSMGSQRVRHSELLFEWKEHINFYFLTTLAIRGGKDLLTISKGTSDKETT